VGFVSIPFAVGAAWAKHAGWNVRLVLPVVIALAITAAFLIWRWLGDWQVKPQVVVSPIEPTWAELLKATLESGPMLQCRATLDEDALRAWQDALSPAVLGSAGVGMIELSLNRAYVAASDRMRTAESNEALQEMMMGKIDPQKSKVQKAKKRETTEQTGPAPAFQLGRQPVAIGLHG